MRDDDEGGAESPETHSAQSSALGRSSLDHGGDRARQAIESATVGIVVYDRELRYQVWNPFMERMTGMTAQRVVGQPALELFPHLTEQGVDRLLRRALAGETVASPDTPYHAPETGERGWVTGSYGPCVDESGEVVGVVATVHNITARKQAEQQRWEAEAKLSGVAEQLPGSVWATDQALRFTLSVGAGRGALGLVPGEAVGRTLQEFFGTDDPTYLPIAMHLRALHGEQVAYIQEFNGRHYDSHVQPARDQNGRLVGTLGIALDVTDRVQAEQQRRRLQASVQHAQKLESLGVLAGGIAHDFNNLLLGILGNAELALVELDPRSGVRRRIEAIDTTAKRAAELVQQMLAYSGEGQSRTGPVHIAELVREMSNLLSVSVSKKARLEFDFDQDLPLIEADASQVRQIAMNLITNASDALAGEVGVISVRTGARKYTRAQLWETFLDDDLPEGPYVFFEVGDTGCGMEASVIPKIFDPFFTTKLAGRGLGLAAVVGIVRAHKGAIRVESEPKTGTRFIVVFPAAGPLHSRQSDAQQSPPLSAASATTTTRDGAVLVVDQDEGVRDLCHGVLEMLGYRVVEAVDGSDALRRFRQQPTRFSCVVLDVAAVGQQGEPCAQALRSIRSDIPLLLTSNDPPEEAAAASGATRILPKPFSLAQLRGEVRALLGAREG